MEDLVEPGLRAHSSDSHTSDSRSSIEVAAVHRLVPVLRDVLKKELRDLRDLKDLKDLRPLHDSLAKRLDAAVQENEAQFETLGQIAKRLSHSLRDKAEVAKVAALVEQHCGGRIQALEVSCRELVARVSRCEQRCSVQGLCRQDADTAADVPLDSQQLEIEAHPAYFTARGDPELTSSTSSTDTARADPPCKDDSGHRKSERNLMRYEFELEQLSCMVIEGQSAMEQLRTRLVQGHEAGAAQRARLDGLEKSLAEIVSTLSRTHGSVGERLQQMQQMLDDLTDAKREEHHSMPTEAILGHATTHPDASRHHHGCLEALRHQIERIESSLSERQDSMENMVSEENRRIWLAMGRPLGTGRAVQATKGRAHSTKGGSVQELLCSFQIQDG